jgi:hypothetical protein
MLAVTLHRRLLLFALPALTVVGAAVFPLTSAAASADPSTCAVDASQVRVGTSENWNDRFTDFGDANANEAEWTGGDGAYTVVIPDGRRLWFFGDTYMGDVDGAAPANSGGRPPSAPMISNSVVVEAADGRALVDTLHTGTAEAPRAYLDAGPSGWFWPGAAVVEDNRLRVLLNRFHRTGPGAFDWAYDGIAIASIALPSLQPIVPADDLPVRNLGGVLWNHVLVQPDADYIYGTKNNNLYVARAPAGDLTGTWKYRTASGSWSRDPARAAPVIADGAGLDTQVVRVNRSFVRFSTRVTASSFPNVIQVYFACSPAGPWSQSGLEIYRTPEGDGDGAIVYGAYAHAATVHAGRVLVSYSVNASDSMNFADMQLYRPRFLRVAFTGLP